MVEIVSLVNEGLGHSSYVVDLGDGQALVIDPARFPTGQRRLAAERGFTIAWTADTHSHADYISGSPELAADGARFLASAAAALEVPHRGVEPGEEVEVADRVLLRVIPTPGHTPDHVAFLLRIGEEEIALFSGGSLMVGALGRTDLLGDEHRDRLARQLFRALRSEVLTLPDDLAVYPTHGGGSFCSAPSGAARTTTIGQERESNPLLGIEEEDEFVERLATDLGSFPTYFRKLPEINRRGPHLFSALPELARLDLAAVEAGLAAGAVLVDARPISAFAEAHPAGALSIQHRSGFASWLGWLVELDRPLVFVLDGDTDREDLVRQCLTIGHDRILGELAGGIETWQQAGLPVAGIPLTGPTGIVGTVLDVRQRPEWEAGHLPAAVHVELGALPNTEIAGGPITVMCGHGERAMTGASVLARLGHHELTVLTGGPADWAAATGGSLVVGP